MHSEINNKPIIKFSGNAHLFFEELITTLFQQGYFYFLESAIQYVVDMESYIKKYISVLPAHAAPRYFDRYKKEMKYITYQPNRRTTWYVFFKRKENRFIVYHITNNHIEGQYIR